MIKRVVIGAVVLAAAVVVGLIAYFKLTDDAPDRLTLDSTETTLGSDSGSAAAAGDVSGTWAPTSDSQVGYRVKEVAFGQSKEAVGRTSKVSGSMKVAGTTVSAVDLSVDMASVASDESRRDSQFRGRIMNVSQFPTATFKLTSPIELPGVTGKVTTKATGDLTLRGTTKRVTIDLTAQRQGAKIAVQGSLPIVFAEWSIPNPTFGPVSTEDHGELELLVVFAKSA